MDPSEVTLLGRVHKESASESMPASKKKKTDHSPKASSKKKSSSKPRCDEIKDLDVKWTERFARLEPMLVSKTFAVPVEPVKRPPSQSVVTSDQPFFDPGTFTTGLSSGVTVGGTSSSLVQTTGEAAVVSEAASKSATHPVEDPGTDVSQQNATQPVEAPGARMATQPVEAPGAGPEVLPSGTGTAALQSDREENLQSEPGSPVDDNFRYGSPDRDLTRDEASDQEL